MPGMSVMRLPRADDNLRGGVIPAAHRKGSPRNLSAYARLIPDILESDPTLSIRGDEAEESWRIVEPILEAWAAARVPLGTYPAGAAHQAAGTD
jgi:glucose-6-phosphate 1-dehydrogenase